MLRIRMVEERIAELYPEQEMRCPVHLCIGQEAVAVGVCASLRPTDLVLSGHRSHGHYLAKGGDLRAMLAEIYGRATGCARGKGGSMHLVDLAAGFLAATPIVASTIPIAVGAALGGRLRGEDRVVVSFFGDAATEEGVFHESVNFAVLKQLPVLFVCENNLYSVHSPLSVRQPSGRSIADLVRGHGLPSIQADGNDVQEVARRAAEAAVRARSGGGPSFLEFITYRWREHCGPFPDNDLGYRPAGEFEQWQGRDPIQRLQIELGLDPDEVADLAAELQAEIDEGVAFARNSPFPEPHEMNEDVYSPVSEP
jgi:pyruvate dehydrogenase E1 component alpha subunit